MLRERVLVLRVHDGFVGRQPLRLARAVRAGHLEAAGAQALLAAQPGVDDLPARAAVAALAVDGLRGGHHHLAHGQAARHHQLVEQRRADGVDAEELAEVREIVLVGGEVEHRLDARERAGPVLAAGHVSLHELGGRVQVGGLAVLVHRLLEAVEDAHLMAARDQRVHRVRADEAGAARDQDPHVTPGFARGGTRGREGTPRAASESSERGLRAILLARRG